MTALQALSQPAPMDTASNDAEVDRFTAATLLAVLETSLHETIARFADVSGKISERVLTRGLMSDIELIVGLQGLDRLQQELAAYAGIIGHCAVDLSSPQEGEAPSDPIAAITLADLKKRLHDRCRNEVAMMSSATDDDCF